MGVVDQVAKGVLHHLDLVDAGILHAPREGEEPGPRRTAAAEGGERGASVVDDPGQVRHRLHVVHDRGLAVESGDRGEERRLDAREPALALERLDQRGLLAADIGAGTGVHDDVERELRAEDLRSECAVGVGVVERLLDPLESERELTAHEDEGLVDLQGVGRDDDAFDQLVRIVLDEVVVLERRRLRLVAVHHQVRNRRLAQHRPLASRGETGATAAKQRRGVNLGGDRLGEHRERLLQRDVAPRLEVPGEREGVRELAARGDNARSVERCHYFASPSARASRAALAAVR